MRRCTVEEFATLRYAIAGAEKLREQIRKAFKENMLWIYWKAMVAPSWHRLSP